MPSLSLIDFEKLDLSRVLFGRSDIDQFLKQRGRFSMIDGVTHYDAENALIVGFKDLAVDDWWAADHIPGRAIFPGVLQCEGSAQLASFDFFKRRPEHASKFLGFAGLDSVRFRGVIQPPNRIVYAARPVKVRNTMFVYEVQGFVERELVFEGQVLGIIL